jgi:archaellum component FlaC
MLYELIDEIFTLIQDQFPKLEKKITNRKKRISSIAVNSCENRSELPSSVN